MTSTTAANLALIPTWEETFNSDIERMVSELYSPTEPTASTMSS